MTITLTLSNQTDVQSGYVNGRIVLPASGQVTVTQGLIPYLALDPTFIRDLQSGSVTVSDGVNDYSGTNAYQYLQNWIIGAPPQNSSDPIAFTLAGMGFSVTADAVLNSANETALLLLSNPKDSGVSARAMFFYAAPESSQGIVTIRAYTNPVVTSSGNALGVQNNLVISGAPLSAVAAYASPVVSNNGIKRISLVSVANGNTDLLNFAQTAILAPGNSLLLTVSISNLGLVGSALTHFYMQWVEA